MQRHARNRILFVDDNEHLRLLTQDFLGVFGYEVVGESNGANFLEKIAQLKPDLILLDLKLGEEDGLVLLAELQQSVWHHLPTIVWSAQTFSPIRDRALQLGAACYLTKPIEPMQLLQAIQTYLPDATAVPDDVSIGQPR
jgi:CheY-like chemotaxis protein